eukprot:NODE_25_length_41203_cov_0.917113.p1 type:complete len:1789 gc:universal NODE_25_length_41203_cov_0.917113:21120-26486(+)
MSKKEVKKFHWKPKFLTVVAVAEFAPVQVDLSAYPETEKLSSNRFHPRDQVELHVGDIASILEELSGWYRGYVFSPSNPQLKARLGIFPANHTSSIRKREYKDSSQKDKPILPSSDDIQSPVDVRQEPDEVLAHDEVQLSVKKSTSIVADFLNANTTDAVRPDGTLMKVRKAGSNPLPDASMPFYITKYAREDPLIDEVTVVLRDWFFNLKTCLRSQDYKSYALTKKNVNNLLRGRRQLLARKHVGQGLSSVRQEILQSISDGNEMQKYHQVIRDKETGEVFTPRLATVMKMHQTHTHLQWHVNPDSKKQQPRSFDVFDQEYLQKEETHVQFHHFYFEIKENQIQLATDGPYEIHFNILTKSDGQPLCETFIVKYDQNKALNPIQYLVTNLAPVDASLDTILLGKIFKREQFSDKCAETVVRRPVGIVLIETKDIFNGKEAQPTNGFFMKLFPVSNENNFGKFYEKILETGLSADYGPKAGGLFVVLKTAVGDLDYVLKSTPFFEPKNTILVNRINFPTVITPTIARNKVHITLRSGDFQRSVSRNIEIAIQLRNNYTGQVIDQSMSVGRGVNNSAVYESSLHYHALSPNYNETFTVDCPLDILTDSHLYFAIRALHSSDKERKETKVISFGFLPIMKDNRMIANGVKDLAVYKYEKSKTSPGTYLTLPFEIQEEKEKQDTLSVYVNLCSSKYPQNTNLFQFLNWKKIPDSTADTFKPMLGELKSVKESEILFALFDILEGLFELQKSAKNENLVLDQLIFQGLLHCIGLTQDNKYSKFEPNVRKFIEEKFNYALAYKFLLHNLIKLIDENSTAGNLQYVKEVRATFKIVHYIFMMIFKSRALQQEKEKKQDESPFEANEQLFKEDINKFVNSICTVMHEVSNDTVLGTQTTILQYLDRIIIEFLKYFGPVATADYTIQMADAVQNKKSTVINYKLVFMMNIVKSPLFKTKQARPILSQAIARWLTNSFLDPGSGDKNGRKDVFRKSVFVLAETLDCMQNVLEVNAHLHSQDLDTDFKSLQIFAKIVPTLIDVFDDSLSSSDVQTKFQTKTNHNATSFHSSITAQQTSTILSIPQSGPSSPISMNAQNPSILSGVIAATMLIIFHLLSKQELLNVFFEELSHYNIEKSQRLIKLMINSVNSMVIGEAFPDEWANLTLFTNKTALKMFEVISMITLGKFSHRYGHQFDKAIWVSLLKGILNLLQNHNFNTRKESQQFKRVEMILEANIEVKGAQFLKALWDSIGVDDNGNDILNYHLQLTNDLMSSVCQLSVSNNSTCQQVASYIIFNMMRREYQFCKSVHRIETMVIDELDKLFSIGMGDETYQKNLIYNLKTYNKYIQVDDQFRDITDKVISNFDQFCNLVLSVRSLSSFGDEYEDERWDGILKLAFFMKTVNKQEIYIKYVHHLSQMQLKKNNFVEAGLTLMNHANILEWNLNTSVPAMEDIGFPKEQSSYDRKEELLLTILEYFDEGKAWEKGISICKDMSAQYQNLSFDYKKLSGMLKREADLYLSILNKERYHSEYFRVGFFGKAWPVNIRNKLFIYRGFEFEKISVFCERIINKHAGAMMLKNNNAPTEEVLNSNKKHIQITAVVAEPKPLSIFTSDKVPDVVKNYFVSNEIENFSFQRPFRKAAKTGNEFLDLWTEKTVYRTAEVFPHALRRSLIVDYEKFEYSPVENALKTMSGKNAELLALEAQFSQKDAAKLNCNPLTMSLNGSVDAPVNGGVPMYKKAFLNDEFKSKFPDKAEFVPQLADAIDEQIIIISRCLDVHAKVVPPAMRPLHENLVRCIFL